MNERIKCLIFGFLLLIIAWVFVATYKLYFWEPNIALQIEKAKKDKNNKSITINLSTQDNDLVKYDLSTLQTLITIIGIFIGTIAYVGYNGLKEEARKTAEKVAKDTAMEEAKKLTKELIPFRSLAERHDSLLKTMEQKNNPKGTPLGDDPWSEYNDTSK